MLTLTVADNADGSGATATVSGTSGAAWTAFAQEVGPTPAAGFSAAASGTGDRTAALPGAGYFWCYVILAAGGPSGLVYYAATDAAKAVYDRIVDGVVARLQGLIFAPLPGGVAPPVVRQKADDVKQTGLPAVIVSLNDLDASIEPEDFESQDMVFYPVRVTIRDRADLSYQASTGQYLLWGQQCSRALRNQRLAGVAEVIDCEVRGWRAVTGKAAGYQTQESSFIAVFRASEVFG